MWSKWYLLDGGKEGKIIRRYTKFNGKTKWERVPKEKYKDLPEVDLFTFLNQLNATHLSKQEEAKELYNFQHAFINIKLKQEFEESLHKNASNVHHIRSLMNYLDEYIFKYFVIKMKSPDPKNWYKHEAQWGEWLISQDLKGNTILQIVQTANRYLSFLIRRFPDQFSYRIKLEPIGRKKMQKLKFNNEEGDREKYINDEDWKTIKQGVTPEILTPVLFSYSFGLRCAEALGISDKSLRMQHLMVDRQLVKVTPQPKYGPPKDVDRRRVPYWFMKPEQVVELLPKVKIMHPDTLGDKFNSQMKKLGLSYKFHDLRRTFITRACRLYHWREVQLAAGHEDVSTTMKYMQDDRELSDQLWRPK